jgi:hypothetical protein
MSNAEKDLNDLKNKLDTGLKLTFKKLLQEKKARNGSFVFSKNGKPDLQKFLLEIPTLVLTLYYTIGQLQAPAFYNITNSKQFPANRYFVKTK